LGANKAAQAGQLEQADRNELFMGDHSAAIFNGNDTFESDIHVTTSGVPFRYPATGYCVGEVLVTTSSAV
jgi:hypothetical protein